MDLNSRCDVWSYQLQPVSLLEEEEGSEGVGFLLQKCKAETKQALRPWPQRSPTRPAQGSHGAQRTEVMADSGPDAGEPRTVRARGWGRLRVLTLHPHLVDGRLEAQ